MPRRSKSQIYVSSTFTDLEAHRAALNLALAQAGHDVEGMEKYPAFDKRPVDRCLDDVAACDIYVLVLALRYGFQPRKDNPDKRAITHLEYLHARARNKPCLVFVLDVAHPWPAVHVDNNALKPRSKIGAFRAEVAAAHGVRPFTTPDSLAAAVLAAVQAHAPEALPDADPRAGYLAWLRRDCETVELLGLDMQESHNLRLGQVYVPAMTVADAEAATLAGGELLLTRLGRSPLYLPGAPGAGKSTFCRWLALAALDGRVSGAASELPETFREVLPESLKGRFPVLCRLREWSGHAELLSGNGRWSRSQLETSLAAWIEQIRPGGLSGAVFLEELKAGRCLLILDGVDEVPESLPGGHLPRRNLLSGLADALRDWRAAGNWLLLTSRPYGLDPEEQARLGLPVASLAELPDPLQDLFVRRWYAAADPPRAIEKARGLLEHLAARPDLAELRANPMLLTALCVKYDEGQRLPQDFYRLYDAVLTQVLYKRYATESERERVRNRLAAVALGMHRGDEEQPRTTPGAEATLEEIDRHLARLAETDWTTEAGAARAADMREDLLSHSGLLLPRAGRRAAFHHLSFQEFLAAQRLHRRGEDTRKLLALHAPDRAWHRSLRFLFCTIADRDSPEKALMAFASLRPNLAPAQLEHDPAPALLLADCLEVAHARGWNISHFGDALKKACEHALHHLAPPERAQLWLSLGRLGLDERPGVGLGKDGLPDIDWVEVPEGPFLYGEAKERRVLEAFRIARYPVTHAQFQAFIDDSGYAQDEWWDGLAERPAPKAAHWADPNVPRDSVSWYEATAFCRWLDARLKGTLPPDWAIRLPDEQEWEKAARGVEGREFPWGDGFRSGHANVNEELGEAGPFTIGRTSAVGLYPLGASPFGGLDMVGNVLEWCHYIYDGPHGSDESNDLWQRVRGFTHCASRFRSSAVEQLFLFGFRLCCAPSQPAR